MKTSKKTSRIKTIDAIGRTLGRVASEAASFLIGKTSVKFERHIYSGFQVTVVNASKLSITPKKLAEIYHTRYSGMPGGLHVLSGSQTALKKGFKELIRLAIYRMLPANKLKNKMMKNLKIEN